MWKMILFFSGTCITAGCGSSKPVAPDTTTSPASKTVVAVQNMSLQHIILHKRMQTGDYKRFAMKPETDVPEFRKLVKERYEARKPEVEALERQLKGQEVEEMAVRSPKTPKSRRRAVRFPKNLR